MTNKTEMPEKIWASYELDCSDFIIAHRAEEGNSYTRTDTIPDMTELQRQNAVLKAFARTIINENCFGYDGEVDGMSAQEQAEKCGLITPHIVTRKMIDEWEENDCYPEGDFVEGDTIYHFSGWVKSDDAKMPIPSKAEVAREFLREIIPRAQKTQKYFQEIGFDKVKHDYVALNEIDYALSFAVAFKEVLKEWEDAESK